MKNIVRLFTIALVLGFLVGCGGGSSSGGNKTSTGGKGTNYNSTFIAAGYAHSFAVDSDGKLWVSGNNERGQLGLGNDGYGTEQNSFRPVTFSGLAPAKIVSVAGGNVHSLVLDSDGRVWASGDSNFGQLGLGNNVSQNSFRHVPTLGSATKIVSIAAGLYHSLALDNNGKVWATGNNYYGQLGLGNLSPITINAFQNITISDLTSVTNVIVSIAAGGSHSLALDSTGRVWAAGHNIDGQLGLGDIIPSTTSFKPATFNNSTSYPRIVSIAAGIDHSLAVDGDGKLWATGYNLDGQLGLGNYIRQNSFQLVTISGLAPAKIVSIAAGLKHSLVLDSDGRIWVSGSNEFGQLGLYIEKPYEFKLVTISGLPLGTKIVSIAANWQHSLALDSDGKIWATGANYFSAGRRGGQLGLGDWDTSHGHFTQVPLFDLH